MSRERQGRPKAIGSGVSGVFIWGVGRVYLDLVFCYRNLSVIGFQVSGDQDIRCVFIECVLD